MTTRAALAACAQGCCYFPDCDEPIIKFIDDEPFVNFEISHICDARPGVRYEEKMTDDERRSFQNLVLFCKPHHQLVDKRDPDRFPSEVLREWKREREAQFRQVGSELGRVSESDLESALLENSSHVPSSIQLGGEGGGAPGAGGGGGGVIGDGRGGPGGPGGDVIQLGGLDAKAPGAGGGGAADATDNGFGGEGGGGGDVMSALLAVEPGDSVRTRIGKGGGPGEPGGDTYVELVGADGVVKNSVRAKGGVAGRSSEAIRDDIDGPSVMLTSAFLADQAQFRDGLHFVLGGGWDEFVAVQFPVQMTGVLVCVAEPVRPGPRSTELQMRVLDESNSEQFAGRITLHFDSRSAPMRINFAIPFCLENVARPGILNWVISSGGVELARVPLRVVGLEESARVQQVNRTRD